MGTPTVFVLSACVLIVGGMFYIGASSGRDSVSTADAAPTIAGALANIPVPDGAVRVRITDRDDTTHDAILLGQGSFLDVQPNSKMRFHVSTGDVQVLMTNLLSIIDIHTSPSADKCSALFTFRTGSPRRLNFGGFTENVVIINQDGMREVIKLMKIQSIEVQAQQAPGN